MPVRPRTPDGRLFARVPIEDRFWKKVRKSEGCWEWIGSRMSSGHGQVGLDKKTRLTHRVSWVMANGPIPAGMCVCHKCDNPPCVRPDHLFLGTIADNIRDMHEKGRANPPCGNDAGRSKLTWNLVWAIKELSGMLSHRAMAECLGVEHRVIGRAISGETWGRDNPLVEAAQCL